MNPLNPYPDDSNDGYLDKLAMKMEKTATAIKGITREQLEKHPDQIAVCRYNYYKNLAKRLNSEGTDDHVLDPKYETANKNISREEKSELIMKYRNKTRTTSFENEQLKITIEEKEMDSSVRHLTPVKSEYIVSVLVGLHSKSNKDTQNMLNKDEIVKLLLERKNIFTAFANPCQRKRALDSGLFTLPRDLREAENHEKQTIASFEQDRNDFERLCSNHTTEQYENHVKKMKNSLSDMGELEKVKTRCKFDIKSSKRTEILFHNDSRAWLLGNTVGDLITNNQGRFQSAHRTRQILMNKLSGLDKYHELFVLTDKDKSNIRKRKQEENLERNAGKRKYIESALE